MPVQTSLLCKDRESQLARECNLQLSTCPTSEGWNEPTCQFCLPVPIEDNVAPFPKLYLLFACSRITLPMPVSMHQHLPKQQRKGQPGEADPWAAEHTRSVLGDRRISGPQRAVALRDKCRRWQEEGQESSVCVGVWVFRRHGFSAAIEAQAGFNKVFKQSRK